MTQYEKEIFIVLFLFFQRTSKNRDELKKKMSKIAFSLVKTFWQFFYLQ